MAHVQPQIHQLHGQRLGGLDGGHHAGELGRQVADEHSSLFLGLCRPYRDLCSSGQGSGATSAGENVPHEDTVKVRNRRGMDKINLIKLFRKVFSQRELYEKLLSENEDCLSKVSLFDLVKNTWV